MNTRFRKIVAIAVLAVTCTGFLLYLTESDSGLQEIKRAYTDGDYAKVRLLAASLDHSVTTEAELSWYAGLACKSLGEDTEALAYFQKTVATAADKEVALDASLQIAEILQQRRQYAAAINLVRALIAEHPTRLDLQRQAAHLLVLSGRRYEANRHRFALVKSRSHSLDDLILLADRHEPYVGPETERVLQNPHATEFRVTRAMIARHSGKLDEAERLLRAEIAEDKNLIEPHALMGLVLLDQGNMSELADWHAALPNSTDDHPDALYVHGAWAEHLNRRDIAITCYLKALRLDADFKQAIFRLLAVAADSISDEARMRSNSRP